MIWHTMKNMSDAFHATLHIPGPEPVSGPNAGCVGFRVIQDPEPPHTWLIIVRPQLEWIESIPGTEVEAMDRALAILRQLHTDLGNALTYEEGLRRKAGVAPIPEQQEK